MWGHFYLARTLLTEKRVNGFLGNFQDMWDLFGFHLITCHTNDGAFCLNSWTLERCGNKSNSDISENTMRFKFMTPLVKFLLGECHKTHYNGVIIGAIASQITSPTIVYSRVYSGADQRKHQSSASLAFLWGIHRWPVNSPHKWPVTRKMMMSLWALTICPNKFG